MNKSDKLAYAGMIIATALYIIVYAMYWIQNPDNSQFQVLQSTMLPFVMWLVSITIITFILWKRGN